MFGEQNIITPVGVRFAEPPVGNLRFKKPVEARGWSGVVDANETGNICYQATSGKWCFYGAILALYSAILKIEDTLLYKCR